MFYVNETSIVQPFDVVGVINYNFNQRDNVVVSSMKIDSNSYLWVLLQNNTLIVN